MATESAPPTLAEVFDCNFAMNFTDIRVFTSPLIQHHFTVNFILPRNSLHLELGFLLNFTMSYASLLINLLRHIERHFSLSLNCTNKFTLLQVFTRFSLNFTSRQTSIQLGLKIEFHLHSRRSSLSREPHFIRL